MVKGKEDERLKSLFNLVQFCPKWFNFDLGLIDKVFLIVSYNILSYFLKILDIAVLDLFKAELKIIQTYRKA